MTGIRRALIWTAIDRYLGLLVGFVFVAAMSRLLTPREIGISALGIAVLGIAEALRDFGATSYLIQRRDVTLEALRTTFTLLLVTAVALFTAMLTAAPWIASAYGEPALGNYVAVLATSFLMGPFAGPIIAVMRRDLEADKLAVISVASTVVNATLAITLALAGFSYMSFAWAGLAAAACAPLIAFWLRPDPGIYRLRLHDWREAVSFGSLATATALLNKAYEALPLLILGRVLSFDAVGLFQRAVTVCQLPDRFVMAAIGPVALPAFSAAVRTGSSLKQAYLQSIEYITAVQWPALTLLAALAYPVVRVLLGPQWLAAAPLVQIMALASLAMFAAVLTQPMLVAVGRIQDTLWMSLISLPLSIVLLVPAAFWSLEAIALSMLVTVPLQVYVAISFIRRRVHFEWRELAGALRKSAVATACALAGPLIVVAANGSGFDMSLPAAGLAGMLAAPGWLASLWLTSHPLAGQFDELRIRLKRAAPAAAPAGNSASARD